VIIGKGNYLCAESVSFNDIRTGIKIFGMDGFDNIRARDIEQVVIALQVAMMIAKTLATKILLGKLYL